MALRFALLVCVGALIPQHASATGGQVVYSGYVVDNLCYNRVEGGGRGLDGSDVINAPADHTVHCLRDIADCYNSGFYVAVRCADGSYRKRFTLEHPNTHSSVFSLISSTNTVAGLKITVTGTNAGGGSIQNGVATECTGNDCDGACTGDCSDPLDSCSGYGASSAAGRQALPVAGSSFWQLLTLLVAFMSCSRMLTQ
mmetsp:Transcript_25393/g.59084  ORF Transcript_25393/g.59084 Transcript_25393/m.59084 type:complete len:198 (+) Transcript_25393:102-695(+)|eukprot:CAMPEP_0178461210 /NCGR_PEP_ID=MMETSP0689_2-20121128/49173_1 /TAXON_ID=160604 /ORGANISM="Amphidinium massartii, Strain CS-259" /LENGTH=197 /DNA_ID=CAMNT_0020088001 /DNA_START=91 /DNA_END=684 /DNA_ORIENTATION=+